ncbi:MAG: helix-turn-helix domain-containing protein [Acidobacteria bacterium]|nr:helix-turn-helix domain-containing protein [Acidobacteriota bacterium]
MDEEVEKMDIKQMSREGHSIKAIHRKTGRSINTVRHTR